MGLAPPEDLDQSAGFTPPETTMRVTVSAADELLDVRTLCAAYIATGQEAGGGSLVGVTGLGARLGGRCVSSGLGAGPPAARCGSTRRAHGGAAFSPAEGPGPRRR